MSGEKVVHKRHAFGEVMGVEGNVVRVKLDFDASEVEAPLEEWKSAFIIEDFVFDIERASLEDLREMLKRAQAIRVAEPSKGTTTRKKKEKAKVEATMALLPDDLQQKLREMGIG
mgnify:CR=1 FL=1